MRKLFVLPVILLFAAVASAQQVDVLFNRYNSSSTDQNLGETILNQSNVNSASFGKLYSFAVDGYVYAQPLYKSNLAIPGNGTHNVVFIATQHDSVFAFDADTATPLWQTSFINPAAGITTQPAADTGATDIIPEVGITSTPVIDPVAGTLFVVAKTKQNGSSSYTLHALDITTGAEKLAPVVIQASVPQTGGGTLSFNANWHEQRPGLVLYNGIVYVAFGSSGDNFTWQGWLLGYNSSTLAQTAVFCTVPSSASGGIWAGGQAPPVDASGNIFISTGNGNFNGTTDFGDSYIKLSTANNSLTVLDYFAPFNQAALETADLDIASAGMTLLPASAGTTAHPNILVGSGKDGTIYVIDRDNMGHYNGSYTNPDSQIIQEIPNALGILPINISAIPLDYVENNYSSPAFWQNGLYFCGINDVCKLFSLNNGLLSTSPASQTATSYAFGGAEPVITAASSTATIAIMWAVERNTTNNITILHAYDASSLATELYNSNQAAGNRDVGGAPVKFVVPTITNGHVFVGAEYEVDVYGLLASNPTRLPAPGFTPSAGTYTTAQSVALSDTNTSAAIYYTLDGSLPTTTSSLYSGPIAVSNTTTINAIAVANGFLTSPVASATFTIGSLATTGGFVQGNYATPQGPNGSVNIAFLNAQQAGDLNFVVVGWNDSTSSVVSVTDTLSNTYTLAVPPTAQSGVGTQAIYYAKNIASASAGGNTVTVTFNTGATSPDIRIAEYNGLDPNNPLDATAAAQGNSTLSNSGTATTSSPTELIVGANLVQTGTTGPGSGFNNRMITNPDGDILEDEVVTSAGTYSATAPVNPAGQWIMQMVTFKGASSAVTPTAPGNLTASVISSTQINLTWTASTEVGGTISEYLIQRCAGSGCTSFTQVGTSTTTGFNDTSLAASTTYSYRVVAQDSSNNLGPFSNIATATTLAAVTPTAPSNLTASATSNTQISLTWGASTETGGTITQYLVERCSGSGCSSFTQVGTSTTTSFGDTGLLGSTTYSYRVRAVDNSNNTGPYSNIASATTQVPTITAPSNLSATAISNTQINLSWTAATETGGTISNYLVERCSGSGCNSFVQVATPTGTTYSDTGLLANTSYSYRVRATDALNDLGPYSSVASATTLNSNPPPPPIAFIQGNSSDPQTSPSSVAITYSAAQRVGDLNVVVVGWNNSTATINSVTDTMGNIYNAVAAPTVQSGTATQAIYYAKNIPAATAGANTVTVAFSGSAAFPDIRILEYSGLDPNNPLDVFAGATGSSTSSNSGSATTTNANDLIIGANLVQTGTTGPGTGFTSRILTNPDSDIVEDEVVTAAGSYSAVAPVSPSGKWIMQMVAFKAAAAVTPTAPTGLTATASGPTQINLSWTAATETGGTINQYLVQRCSGSGCSNFVQVGTSTTTTYSDTGLTGSTSYSYRVQASDTNNVTGPFSNTATATTAAPTFTAPSGLTAAASSPAQVNLSWTAATETGGTITQYLIQRCSGSGCSSFTQVGTSTTTSYSDTGLTGSTSYSYRVQAADASNNTSGFSNTATTTTPAPTFTAPSSLTATAASSTQINLSWTAATETGGTITQYLIQRCSGSGCSSFTQVGTSTSTTYSDTGLSGSTSYSYRVEAADASNNTSGFSNTATATTSGATPTAPTNLAATANGPTQINLSWTASTETGGTISQYLIQRCSGSGCSNFVQVGTSTTTTYSDTGLTGSTSYSYRVQASDTNNVTGPFSNTATATTAAPTFTAPSGLTAAASSPAQVNLSWTAATETGGTIKQYLVQRCSGSGCSSFTQVGTSTTTTYSDTGLTGSTSYSYRVQAADASNNTSGFSNTATTTTPAPTFTAPSNLTATAAGSTQINLSWTAATETGGTITQYLIQSCTGSGCTNFAQIGTSTTVSFSNTGLTAGTTYTYRVQATDANSNTSPFSNTASATTSTSAPPPITFVQENSADPQTPQSSVAVKYTSGQGAGDLNVVVVGWNDSTATVKSVTDSSGNVYVQALAPTVQSGTASQVIYYAANIVSATANSNTVTVTFNGSAVFPDIRILEYSGIAVTSPVDVTAGATGSSTSSSSGAVTTTNANDLIIGANLVQTGTTGAGSSYTRRVLTSPDGDIVEDRVVTATGSYTATAPVSPSGKWIMQLVAFKRHP